MVGGEGAVRDICPCPAGAIAVTPGRTPKSRHCAAKSRFVPGSSGCRVKEVASLRMWRLTIREGVMSISESRPPAAAKVPAAGFYLLFFAHYPLKLEFCAGDVSHAPPHEFVVTYKRTSFLNVHYCPLPNLSIKLDNGRAVIWLKRYFSI